MLYAVLFEDNEEQAHQRSSHMDEHLAFLAKNAARITSAGPLTNAEQQTPAGGLWLVDAENRVEVEKLIHEDPLWPTGLRKSIRILEWHRVFVDGETLQITTG